MKSPKGREILLKVFEMVPPTRHALETIDPRQGFLTERRIIVGGVEGTNHFWKLENMHTEPCWLPFHDIPWREMCSYEIYSDKFPGNELEMYSVCHTESKLIITGGYIDDELEPVADVYALDTLSMSWRSLPQMNFGRCRHMSVAEGDTVLVMGGSNEEHGITESVEQLDMLTLRWSAKSRLPMHLRYPVLAKYDGQIYLFGGLTVYAEHSVETLAYSLTLDKWRNCRDMPESCEYGASATIGDSIYVVGGFTRVCLLFKPCQDQWTRLTQSLVERVDCAATPWADNRLLVCGGRHGDGGQQNDTIEEYDIATDTWTMWHLKLPCNMSLHVMTSMEIWKQGNIESAD